MIQNLRLHLYLRLKQSFLFGVLLALTAARAHSLPYVESFTNSPGTGAIPDGSPLGVVFSGSVIDIPAGSTVSGLTLDLNISGGFNGNLYAYLQAPNSLIAVLMNRPGVSGSNPFGATGAGMDITLQDGLSDHGSIQNETSSLVLTGSYNAADPLADVNGSAADGTWDLYLADLVVGGGASTVNTWTLNVSTVPEPNPSTLEILGALILLGSLMTRTNRSPRKQLLPKPQSAP